MRLSATPITVRGTLVENDQIRESYLPSLVVHFSEQGCNSGWRGGEIPTSPVHLQKVDLSFAKNLSFASSSVENQTTD